MEVGSLDGQRRGQDAPRLPGGDPTDRPVDRQRTPRSRPVGHRSPGGYAGLVPPLRSTPGSLPTIDDAARPSPSLPLTAPSLPDPAPAPSAEHPAPSATPEPTPIDPYTHLPTEPADELTPTPAWKPRHRSTARRRAGLALALIATAGIVAAIWVIARDVLPSGDDESLPVDSVPASEFEREDGSATSALRPSVASLHDELQRARDGRRFTSGPVRSFAFGLEDPFRVEARVAVDLASGDVQATLSPNIELRRVDGRTYGRAGANPWVELSAEAASSIPPALLAGPLTRDDVLPPALAELAVEERQVAGGVEIVLDDARLAAEQPAARDAWLAGWGFDPAASAARDRDANELVVTIVGLEDGTVRSASITSPTIGGRVAYELLMTAGEPYVVAPPQLRAG